MEDILTKPIRTPQVNGFRGCLAAKIVAMVLLAIFTIGLIVSSASLIFMYEGNLNLKDKSEVKAEYYKQCAEIAGYEYVSDYLINLENVGHDKEELEAKYFDNYCESIFQKSNITGLEIYKKGKVVADSFSERYNKSNSSYTGEYNYYTNNDEKWTREYKIYVDDKLLVYDEFKVISMCVDYTMDVGNWNFLIAIASFVGAVVCFIFLIVSAGWRRGKEELVRPFQAKIPLEIYVFLMITLVCSIFLVGVATSDLLYPEDMLLFGFSELVIAIIGGVVIMLGIMNLAIRVKRNEFFTNTLIYMVFFKTGGKVKEKLVEVIGKLPLIKKTVVFLLILNVLFLLLGFVPGGLVVDLVLVPALIYFAFNLNELKIGAKKLAEGELDYKINTEKMYFDFKESAEDLNSISLGMGKAVEERMKSEYFKTELITNVSHDLKTPLTSVINYADLISKEETDNENIKEYTDILMKHSNRLKRLVEDLVEASKASTGNLEISLAPFKIGVFASQTVGEYEEKFKAANLELVVKDIDENMEIMADGRRIWRVFDNLMNNICKYAVAGSRVYLDVERTNGNIQITFKNISKEALNIEPHELMERFVRGDESRNTEGNGLGLSIAKSMVELQNGKMDVVIDGDLFKVILVFSELV